MPLVLLSPGRLTGLWNLISLKSAERGMISQEVDWIKKDKRAGRI